MWGKGTVLLSGVMGREGRREDGLAVALEWLRVTSAERNTEKKVRTRKDVKSSREMKLNGDALGNNTGSNISAL